MHCMRAYSYSLLSIAVSKQITTLGPGAWQDTCATQTMAWEEVVPHVLTPLSQVPETPIIQWRLRTICLLCKPRTTGVQRSPTFSSAPVLPLYPQICILIFHNTSGFLTLSDFHILSVLNVLTMHCQSLNSNSNLASSFKLHIRTWDYWQPCWCLAVRSTEFWNCLTSLTVTQNWRAGLLHNPYASYISRARLNDPSLFPGYWENSASNTQLAGRLLCGSLLNISNLLL